MLFKEALFAYKDFLSRLIMLESDLVWRRKEMSNLMIMTPFTEVNLLFAGSISLLSSVIIVEQIS